MDDNTYITQDKKVIKSRQELITIFKDFNELFRDAGLRAGLERVGLLSNMLFLKIISELAVIDDRTIKVPPKTYLWDNFKNKQGLDLLDFLNKQAFDHFKTAYGGEVLSKIEVVSGKEKILNQVIEKLDDLQLSDTNSDIKGDAFEFFLRNYGGAETDLGEYFTPRHIVKVLVKLLNPRYGETVYDPFCGTGGMLIESFKHIKRKMPQNAQTIETLKKGTVYGCEITDVDRIAKMNMILAGDGHSNIKRQNSYEHRQTDKHNAHKEQIWYFTVKSDGYSLDRARRPVETNDLKTLLQEHDLSVDELERLEGVGFQLLSKEKLQYNKYILLSNSYREEYQDKGTAMIAVSDLFKLTRGRVINKEYIHTHVGNYPVYSSQTTNNGVLGYIDTFDFDGEYITWTTDGVYAGEVFYRNGKFNCTNVCGVLTPIEPLKIDLKYCAYVLNAIAKDYVIIASGIPKLMNNVFSTIKIPLPPLGEQRRIAEEIERRESVIDGARQVVKNWKPNIDLDPAWELVELGDVCELVRGITYSKNDEVERDGFEVLRANNIKNSTLNYEDVKIVSKNLNLKEEKKLKKNDIFICLASGSKSHIGKVAFVEKDTNYYCGGFMGAVRLIQEDRAVSKYIFFLLDTERFNNFLRKKISGVNINNLSRNILGEFKIPLPPIEEQKRIVAEIEAQEKIIQGCKELIKESEKGIADKIQRIWNE